MGIEDRDNSPEKGVRVKKIGRHFYWSIQDSAEKSEIPDLEIFSAYAALVRSRSTMERADKDWFIKLQSVGMQERDVELSGTATRKRIIELYKRCKDTPTAVLKKLSL